MKAANVLQFQASEEWDHTTLWHTSHSSLRYWMEDPEVPAKISLAGFPATTARGPQLYSMWDVIPL